MSIATGYARVSSDLQAKEGVSLSAQREKLEAWAASKGLKIELYVDEGISGATMDKRPNVQKAIARACELHCPLVVYSLSRLARSTEDAIRVAQRLEQAGADLVSLTENIDTTTATGKMVYKLLAVLAEFERDLLIERTKVAMALKRSQNLRISRFAQYGFDFSPDGRVRVNEAEQNTIGLIKMLHSSGKTLRQICSVLKDRNISPRDAKQWYPGVIASILRRDNA